MAVNFPKCILKASGHCCGLDSLLGPGGWSGKGRPFKGSPGSSRPLLQHRPLSANVSMPTILDRISEGSRTSHGWFPHSLWTPREEALPGPDPSVLQSGTQDLKRPRPKRHAAVERGSDPKSMLHSFIHSFILQILTEYILSARCRLKLWSQP